MTDKMKVELDQNTAIDLDGEEYYGSFLLQDTYIFQTNLPVVFEANMEIQIDDQDCKLVEVGFLGNNTIVIKVSWEE